MPGRAVIEGPEPKSILLVLPTWVGDMVMATPTLRAVRRRFPHAHITFLAEPNLCDLLDGGDWMDEVCYWPGPHERSLLGRPMRALRGELRQRPYDWAVLLPNSFRAAVVAWLSGAKRRIGYHRDGRGLLLTDRLPVRNRRDGRRAHLASAETGNCSAAHLTGAVNGNDRPDGAAHVPGVPRANPCADGAAHTQTSLSMIPGVGVIGDPRRPPVRLGRYLPMPLVDYYADLAEALGCDRPDDRLELFTTPDEDALVERRLVSLGVTGKRPLVAVSPGARYGAAKCWPPECFAAAADRLIETEGAAVLITCGPGEEPIARAIGGHMKQKGHVLDEPRLSLGGLKSLMRRCDLLLCNDAGPRHIAKAFGVPVVPIFGPTHPDWTATRYPAERIVRLDIECGPCQQRVCPLVHWRCMTELSVDMVVAAARELWQDRRNEEGRAT